LAQLLVLQVHLETISECFQGIASAAARDRKQDVAIAMFARSRRSAEKITSTSSKARRLREIAVAQADAGDRAAASTTLESAWQAAQKMAVSDSTDVDTLVELAKTQAAIGARESARKTLSFAVMQLSHRSSEDAVASLLRSVARAQAWFVSIEDALQVADKETPSIRAYRAVGTVQGILARRERQPLFEKIDPLRAVFP
jgi:hypothetical protein